MKKNRIGILGGSFNPIHIAHLLLAEYTLEILGLNKIIFIPTSRTPLKDESSFSPSERLAMVRAAVQDDNRFAVSDIEIQRDNISYTYITIAELQKEYPNAHFYLIIGYDNFLIFDKWRRYEEILEKTTIVVLRRFKTDDIIQKNNLINQGDFIFLDSPVINITSTKIRERIKEGNSVKYYLPSKVNEFIRRSKKAFKRVSV